MNAQGGLLFCCLHVTKSMGDIRICSHRKFGMENQYNSNVFFRNILFSGGFTGHINIHYHSYCSKVVFIDKDNNIPVVSMNCILCCYIS